MEMKKRLREKS